MKTARGEAWAKHQEVVESLIAAVGAACAAEAEGLLPALTRLAFLQLFGEKE